MIGECRIIRCFHGRYAADHRAGCIVEGDAGGNGGIVVTQADSNPCGAAVDVGGDEIVLDALFRSVQQVDITENAVHAEHILIFHVAAIAPFQHEDRQMVGAVLQKLRYIELACGMGDLTVPDKLTVEPDVEAGGNTLKIQKCARGSGILLVGEVVEVSAAGILFGNIRWISGERIADVGVLFDFGKIKKIAKSANMLLSIDIHDFLPIEKEVYCIVAGEEQPVKKKLVLVFDDFERCKIGVIDLLGIINTYVEDKRIKTIVIASEDNIEDEENYKTFKEKVVERTVKLDMEYRRIQQEMIEDYKTETSEYKEFLKKESPKLFQVFEESGSRNLRTFKSCLIDFERVYGLWHSLKLPTDGMGEALYVFAAYLFEVKGGNYKKMDYLKNPTYERGLAAKSKILVCFNDELLAAFLSAYKKANISEQQEMLTILKEISFRGGAVERDETDTEVTRKNLEKLENALNSEVEHTSDAVKKFYANRHLETVKQIRQKFLNTREM